MSYIAQIAINYNILGSNYCYCIGVLCRLPPLWLKGHLSFYSNKIGISCNFISMEPAYLRHAELIVVIVWNLHLLTKWWQNIEILRRENWNFSQYISISFQILHCATWSFSLSIRNEQAYLLQFITFKYFK